MPGKEKTPGFFVAKNRQDLQGNADPFGSTIQKQKQNTQIKRRKEL